MEIQQPHPNALIDGDPDLEPIGARIRRLRIEQQLGQERLAIEAGVDQSGLSKFERGKDHRSIGEAALRRLARVLDITFEDLVGGTDYFSTKSGSR
jgi:transcriptional regulator with XRE-family HTH domain